jgi:catechol 2,3-dioxygenase-like lactoylglutathione lyase family enzyme
LNAQPAPVAKFGLPGGWKGATIARMQLAKKQIDVGLYTNDTEAMLTFWQTKVGLRFEGMQPIGQGVQQHRHEMNGSVLKLNSVRDPMPKAKPSGYRELWIASPDLAEPEQLWDSDGNSIRLVLPGYAGVYGIALKLEVTSAAPFREFFGSVMRLESAGKHSYRIGDSLIMFEPNARAVQDTPMRAKGYRYFTIQVTDVDREHSNLVQRGAVEAMAPITLGDVARVSFIRDPDGNWIELSQRASLTGSL